MLFDPRFSADPDPIFGLVAAMHGGSGKPSRLGAGFYQCGHWNFGDLCTPSLGRYDPNASFEEKYDALARVGLESEHGVCDTPEQFMERFGPALAADTDGWVVSFVVLQKADQSPRGGWRWHKWGPYIGDKTPQCEYLYDEGPEITQATTFSLFRVKAA